MKSYSNVLATNRTSHDLSGQNTGHLGTLPSSRDLALLRAIRLPEVLHLSGDSRSGWYARLNPKDPSYDPDAPKPFKLGKSPHSPSLWWAWQVVAYLESKAAGHING